MTDPHHRRPRDPKDQGPRVNDPAKLSDGAVQNRSGSKGAQTPGVTARGAARSASQGPPKQSSQRRVELTASLQDSNDPRRGQRPANSSRKTDATVSRSAQRQHLGTQRGDKTTQNRRESTSNSAQPNKNASNQPRVRARGVNHSAPIEARSRAVKTSRDANQRERQEAAAREARRRARAEERNRGPLGFSESPRRLTGLSIVFSLLVVTIVARLAYVQLIDGPNLAQAARNLRTTTVELVAERGSITDRNGNAIAESVTRYKIFADQELIEEWKRSVEVDGELVSKGGAKYAAELLAPVLDLDAEELATKLTKAEDQERYDKYLTIVKEVPPETWEAVKDLGISGIFPETLNKRIYPHGDTAHSIIGKAGTDGGLSGLEFSMNDQLSGEKGSITYERSGHGYMLPSSEVQENPAKQGLSIRSTLDMDIQWHAEKALDEQLKKTGGSSGSVIVQDIDTCEILALADRSTTSDGNTALTGRLGAVLDVFEPGSTAKIITMAAAIETGVATPLTEYVVPYMYNTSNGQTFRDSHDHPTQKMTLTGILADSSNTGTVQVGESIPKQVRYDYLYKFGFGQRTGIELSSESRGILHDVEDWDGRTQYGVLFGQGVSATALQATNVFATIAHDGQACQPHLIAGTTDNDGVFTESEKSETDQIVSKETANQVLKMMESVVVEGSGRAGAIEGYRVAGKTGTAQATGADGKLSSFVSSFIGVAPVENPELVVSVIIHDPQTSIWGGEVAAPVFADVMAYSLQQLRVEPSTKKPSLYDTEWK